MFGSAIIYLHRDPQRRDRKDVLAAAELLHAIRPFVRNIDPAPIAPLATGDVCLELAWSELVTTDVFNSNKCFAVFQEGADARSKKKGSQR